MGDGEWLKVAQRIREGKLARGEAYERFRALRKEGRLKGMGPAYFTKLIYFLTPRRSRQCKPPYIMDRWAGSSVNLLTGSNTVLLDGERTWKDLKGKLDVSYGFTVSDANTDDDYEAFCTAVDRLAADVGLCADQVDCALFSKGEDGPVRGAGTWRSREKRCSVRLSEGVRTDHRWGRREHLTGKRVRAYRPLSGVFICVPRTLPMKKSELAADVATQASLSRAQAERVVDAVFSVIGEALARDESVVIAGFGTFATKTRAARQGRNRAPASPSPLPPRGHRRSRRARRFATRCAGSAPAARPARPSALRRHARLGAQSVSEGHRRHALERRFRERIGVAEHTYH